VFHKKIESDRGSAILEFIVFILVGQLLVFGWSVSAASSLYEKVSIQIQAEQVALNLAHGTSQELPEGTSLQQYACSPSFICVALVRGNLTAQAVGMR
jgi:hypothetical protein